MQDGVIPRWCNPCSLGYTLKEREDKIISGVEDQLKVSTKTI